MSPLVQHSFAILHKAIDYHRSISEMSTEFSIDTYRLALVFKQEKGLGTLYVQVKKGLSPTTRIHVCKVECAIQLDDNKPDPLPWTYKDFSFSDKLVALGSFNDYGFRGTRTIYVELTYSWSHKSIVSRIQPSPGHPHTLVSANEKSEYAAERSEDTEFGGRDDKKLKIEEKVDFGDSKISISKKFSLTIPDQNPYMLIVHIVRDPNNYRRRQVQLGAASPGEVRGIPLSKLSIEMTIGESISIEDHCFPETQYEGSVYLLILSISIPPYGIHVFDATLKMRLPTQAIVSEVDTRAEPGAEMANLQG